MALEPKRVHVIPPNTSLRIEEGHLRLEPRPQSHEGFSPIDLFFRSLAHYAGHRAIGIVLSGTASDGADGLREIKAQGGITFAQSPESAKYDGMPRAAIATGLVDFVLAPAQIAEELLEIRRHPYLSVVVPRRPGDGIRVEDGDLEPVLKMLRRGTGVDFTSYKMATIRRRLQRRMALHKLTDVKGYVKLLGEQPEELRKLYKDILIDVTRFFREPESFETLEKFVFPAIMERRGEDEPIRIWIPGCSTGEEAYSIAIKLVEFLGDDYAMPPIQVFATDLSEHAISHARAGVYPSGITEDVSPERLRHFFVREHDSYRIKKQLRDLCIFARQDLTQDPPFSRMDLIVCRNVLIYMGAELQRKVLSVFHYALKPEGFLMLGSAETVGLHGDGFSFVDKDHRLFRKKRGSIPRPTSFPGYSGPREGRSQRTRAVQKHPGQKARDEAVRFMLEQYAPASVLVDAEHQIVETRGRTGRYLELPSGEPALDILKMAREGLLHGLRAALEEAGRDGGLVRKRGLRLRSNGEPLRIDLTVLPVGTEKDAGYFLIVFDEPGEESPEAASEEPATTEISEEEAANGDGDRVRELERELLSTRQYLHSMIQDLEAANEELQSANEEILSSNEELQSTNEELDTAKEELQATNEELNTLNDELHGRNEELTRANDDLMNLFASIDVAVVIVSKDLTVRRFTAEAGKLFNLIPTDVGRPIGQIRPNLLGPDLDKLIREAVDEVSTINRHVQDEEGHPYVLRVRPYKDSGSRIEGAILVLFPLEAADEEISRLSTNVLEIADEAMALLDGNLTVSNANHPFYRLLGISSTDARGRRIEQVVEGRMDGAALRSELEKVLAANRRIEGMRMDLSAGAGEGTKVALWARRVGSRETQARVLMRFVPVRESG